ncbi:MAG TPA: D-2-hydroxyacid dehydrogenase [Herpetosiphonaceae bacterium]
MDDPTTRPTVLIASYLEPEYVEQIRAVDRRLHVIYEPELLRPPRFPSDHIGQPWERTPEQERRWRELLCQGDILFDFDHTHLGDLPELAPRLRWIQATSAGIGQLVSKQGYATRMPNTVLTTASGVHAQPLAEFCLLAILTFSKGLLRTLSQQERKHWQQYSTPDLAGRTLLIVGAGKIGQELARLAQALHMKVIGIKRTVTGVDPAALFLDQVYDLSSLHQLLPQAEFLVLITPHTPETEQMIGATELALLPRGAVLINIGRGALVDEAALLDALRSGRLGGAGLDVFAQEPLPPDSPLWELPNVLISPHSGGNSQRENARLVDLFCDNLRRWLADQPLRNVFNPETLY